jgi:hypothetical protein
MDERIILFSKEELAINSDEKRIIDFIESFCNTNVYDDINDVIELYNVRLYFNGGGLQHERYIEKWDFYKTQTNLIWSKICCYFNTLTDENIVKHYCLIEDFIYKEYFWELFAKCNIMKNISSETFVDLFKLVKHKADILKNRSIVKYYDIVLAELLKSFQFTAELLLSHYEMAKQDNKNKMYFPESLSLVDKDEIVSKYIDSDFCNPNYLYLAVNAKDHDNFKLSDKTKLKARKKYSADMQRMFDSGSCAKMALKTIIGFSKEQQEPRTFYIENDACVCSYSILWIKQHNTAEQLFFNLKYLFEFINDFGIINLVPHVAEFEILDVLGLHSDNEYNCGMSFRVKNQIAIGTFVSYKQILFQDGIIFETITKDVFNNYCKYIGIENLSVNIATNDGLLSKIRFLAPELEAVLKKYKIYVENGMIDLELLSINSSPIRINEIPSLVERKYVCCVENAIGREMIELFSEHSLLRFNFEYSGRYKNLYDLLLKESIDFNDIEDFQKKRFENLILKKYLYIENGFIRFCDSLKMSILNELYANDAISYWFLPDEARKKVDMMVEKGELCFQKTLFTKEESDYFNYFLNKTFGNGEDLRNKYVHGTHYPDEQIMENDYNRLLLLFVLILLKIIDDILCNEIMKAENNNE